MTLVWPEGPTAPKNANLCAVWHCVTHGVYYDLLEDRTHDDCPQGLDKPGEPILRFSLQPREVIYYLNEAKKSRQFIQQLRRFIDAGGMLAPDVIIVDRT